MRAGTAGLILLGGIIAFSIVFSGESSTDDPSGDLLAAHGMNQDGHASALDRAIRSYDDFLRNNTDSLGTVGSAAIIVSGDRTVYTFTHGVRRAGTTDSVDLHTIFRLASVSKGFAGVLATLLEEEGYLEFDDRVVGYLPGFRLKDSLNTNTLTIEHLLNHTTGLVPHAYDNLAEAGQSIHEILPRLVEVDIALPPGEVYGYQNVMFSLTDTIMQLATGEKYPDLLQEKIFGPLNMKDASAGFRDLVWNPDVAFPHYKRGGRYYPLPLHSGYYNLLPAAGVNASISDLGLWLKALLGYAPETLSPAIRELIITPNIKTPLKRSYTRRWDKPDGKYYSYGWRIFDYKGYRLMYHGGYVRGYHAQIAFCPVLNVGIAYLQNSPYGVASRSIPEFFNRLADELLETETETESTLSNPRP